MGHMKLRPRKVALPRDMAVGFQLKRVQPPAEEPAPVVAAGECLPHFEGWVVTTDPAVLTPQDLIDGFQIIITPHPDNDTCGSCLEWAASVLYVIAPADPSIESLVPAEDCRGVVATIAPQPGAGDFVLAFQASTENGQPYGTVVHFIPDTPQVACFETTGDGACYPSFTDPSCFVWGYPLAQDWSITVTWIGPLSGGTFAWNPSETAGPHPTGDVTYFESVDGFGRPTLTITNVYSGTSYPEDSNWALSTSPTDDGSPVVAEACFYEAGNWSLQQLPA